MKRFKKLLSVNTMGELSIVKSLLDNANIPYYVTNENFSSIYGGADGLTQMEIIIQEDKLEEAKDILRDFI